MKKIISVLLLALSLTLFSSCIIFSDGAFSKYSITCNNNTSITITDWCVKKGSKSFANDEENRKILPGRKDTIKDLAYGYYSICITFDDVYQLQPENYEESAEVLLDEDVEFDVTRRKFYSRSASDSETENLESEYVITINGKEYPLIKK